MDNDDLPTEYDVIVVGTGLVESVVAAACSRIGKRVLHLDTNSYYGHLWATFSLENFEQWLIAAKSNEKKSSENQNSQNELCRDGHSLSNLQWKWLISEDSDEEPAEQLASSSENKPFEGANEEKIWTRKELKKLSQKFNIDLAPRILFSKGPMVELLIRSGVTRYTEFVNVHNVLLYINSAIESVPYSKSDVFSTRSVSVVDKRILMKLLQAIQNFNHESQENERCKSETFFEFLKQFQIPENIEKYILYSIARVSKKSPCIDGIKAAQYFLNSLGIYGNSPFLWPLYGSSELVQAFCRLCAVYGGIYCLNRGADEIIVENNKCLGILSNNKKLIGEHIVMSASQTPSKYYSQYKSKAVSRGILITNKTLYSPGKKGPSLLQFPSEDPSLAPITIIELDYSTSAIPKGLYLVHMIKVGPDKDYKEFDKVLQELFESSEGQKPVMVKHNEELITEKTKPCVLFKLYFNVSQKQSEPSNISPKNLYTCDGPVHFELDFFSALQEAENIFKQMYPDEEFLPAPPETPTEG